MDESADPNAAEKKIHGEFSSQHLDAERRKYLSAADLDLSKKSRETGLGGEDLKLKDRAATIAPVHDGRTGRVHVQNSFPVFTKSDEMGKCIHHRLKLSEPFAVPRHPQSCVCYLADLDLAFLQAQLEMESFRVSHQPRFLIAHWFGFPGPRDESLSYSCRPNGSGRTSAQA